MFCRILSNSGFSSRAAIKICRIDAQSESIASFGQKAGGVSGVSRKVR